MCPLSSQLVEFQGKYSSEIFKYIKISLAICSGVVNGQGCHTAAEIDSFIAINEAFGFNYYFINALINPVSYFLDDTNHYTFSLVEGVACNFFLEGYDIRPSIYIIYLNYGVWSMEGVCKAPIYRPEVRSHPTRMMALSFTVEGT
jgi:hypothetical protein